LAKEVTRGQRGMGGWQEPAGVSGRERAQGYCNLCLWPGGMVGRFPVWHDRVLVDKQHVWPGKVGAGGHLAVVSKGRDNKGGRG